MNECNAILGISVGHRNFSKEKISELVNFSSNKFKKTLILLVDSIKKYNWMAFYNMDETEANNKAITEGIQYRKAIERTIITLANEKIDVSNIYIMNRNEISDLIPWYKETLNILKEEYIQNKIFKNDCLKMTEKYIESKQIEEITLEQKEIAVNFLLNELSLFLLIGISTKEKYCIDIYPGRFPVMENIINKKYTNLSKKLPQNIIYGHIEIEY